MSGTQPVAVYAMPVPPGGILIPASPDFAAMLRVSMAAIDPNAEPEYDDVDDKKPARATLKIVRVPGDMFDDEDDSDYDTDEDGEDLQNGMNGVDDDESSDEEENGGPSDPEKAKKGKKARDLAKAIAEANENDGEDELSEGDAEAVEKLKTIMKGKAKAAGEGEEDTEDLDSEEGLEMEEVVVCTLDPEKQYQQPLDIVIGEGERVFFKVTGTHTIYLTGNYVIPTDDGQAGLHDDDDDEEEEYDLSPDETELLALEDEEDESDELDDMEDPRVMEVDTDEEEEARNLLDRITGKGKNKRAAPPSDDESDEEANLDDIMAKSLKAEAPSAPANAHFEKLSKGQKKKLKKLKKNDGGAATVTPSASTGSAKASEPSKDAAAGNGEKKVQFAKNLEQGPTPSATPRSKEEKKSESRATDGKPTTGVKEVQGVKIDDRNPGTGPTAKKGSKVEMRYIGKLENGKVFDANKKGKPFSFTLGAGEVIKGWDIGVAGMGVGGERRITVPARLAYGSKGAPPDIPPNATLQFDLKMLTVS